MKYQPNRHLVDKRRCFMTHVPSISYVPEFASLLLNIDSRLQKLSCTVKKCLQEFPAERVSSDKGSRHF